MHRLIADELSKRKIGYAQEVSIKGYTTLGVEATAAMTVFPTEVGEAVFILDLIRRLGADFKTVGKMSNSIPKSSYYGGVIVNTAKMNRKTVAENLVTVDAGATLSSLVRYSAEYRLGGMEQLLHIPGTVGGSVAGNAGAHGREIADVFLHGSFYEIRTGDTVTLTKEQLDFSYRHSRLKNEPYILLDATFSMTEKPREQIFDEVRLYGLKRSNQPLRERTLGSTFKRYGGVSAGYYIDMAGLKGLSVGGAEVSTVHAGFIVNRGGATPEDVIELVNTVKSRVYEKFGIMLEEEIEFF